MDRASLDSASPRDRISATAKLSTTQKLVIIVILAACEGAIFLPSIFLGFRIVLGVCFLAGAMFRLWCVAKVLLLRKTIENKGFEGIDLAGEDWPQYTIVLALYREAHMVPTLLRAIHELRYPQGRMEILVATESDDHDTLRACLAFKSAIPLNVVFGGGDAPKTKPRALNAALHAAKGDVIVVYDAEDLPHPNQLQEAAIRFVMRGEDLGVAQAPLRILIDRTSSSLQRHFAIDYAALFEVTLPALASSGWPFPLGGSSNHFRREALLRAGGWDPWNVTEDADIGFELARLGYQSELLRSPTFETAPRTLWPWIKQRSRWIKGHLQTLKVHTRRLSDLNPAIGISLLTTLSMNLASAASTGPIMLVAIRFALPAALNHQSSQILPFDMIVFFGGWGSAVLCMGVGSWRAGARISVWHFLLAPAFWAAQSLAFARAVHQLLFRPYHWDKTDHVAPSLPGLDANLGFGLSGGGDHSPSTHGLQPQPSLDEPVG
jgi:cellulose synthase/poly-beta-1,6-N-acetylglucosamine synthase-like glycosyltransferase